LVDPLVAVRAVHFASTVLFAGTIIFRHVIADDRATDGLAGFRRHLQWIAALSLAFAAASGVAWLGLFAAGLTADEALAGSLARVLAETQFGWVWSFRAVVALLLALLVYRWISRGVLGRAADRLLLVLAVALVASLAGLGHAAASLENWRLLHLAADMLHLAAAAAWLGGLVPLALLLRAARTAANEPSLRAAQRSTVRFSTCGIVSVGTLFVTGVISTWFLAGTVPALVGTPYGRLLLLKIGCFLAVVAIAAVNRRRLTPRLLSADGSAIGRLQRNIAAEIFLGIAILIVVAALGTIPPGGHVQASWPFPLRPDEAKLAQMSSAQTLAVLATAGGLVLMLAGLALRGYRWLILPGLVIPLPFVSTLLNLTTEAAPTSYYASPTGYSVQAIARGQDLFAQHCGGCHGRWGEGVVPSRDDQKMPPDLAGDHVYARRDGELFWSITHGIENGMPGFGAVLDEDARWALVDFIRANADGARLRSADGEVTAAAFPMPDFAVECSDGKVQSVRQLRGRKLHVVAGNLSSPQVMQRLPALRGRSDALTIAADMNGVLAKDAALCTASDDDLIKALSVFRGRELEGSDTIELLVDSEGRLRAAYTPGAEVDWSKAEVMGEAMRKLDGPVSRRPSAGGHVH
jgi:copper resistance protein D